ncbi:MAG: 2-phosphosulfolactate phosphatase, partial [Bacteroidota bacterium]
MSKKWVGVCMTPALIDQFDIHEAIVVVIDVLRATTTMCTAFDHGVKAMIPVLTVEEGREMQKKGYLVAGERNGEKIEEFDFGNSPFSFMSPRIKDREIVITTTNGTKALRAAVERNAKEVVIGSFANASKLAEYLIQRNENVVFLCAGWKDRPNLEDTAFAGAMVRKLCMPLPRGGYFRILEDTALISEALYRMANWRKRYYLRFSSHFARLFYKLQIQKDVKYAMRRDTHAVIPRLIGDHLVELNSPHV